jgi:hypothetical protein
VTGGSAGLEDVEDVFCGWVRGFEHGEDCVRQGIGAHLASESLKRNSACRSCLLAAKA